MISDTTPIIDQDKEKEENYRFREQYKKNLVGDLYQLCREEEQDQHFYSEKEIVLEKEMTRKKRQNTN